MKYGQTLRQRSIPEWGPYNIDYDDLKRLIKIRTSRGGLEASVEGPRNIDGEDARQTFEDELYDQLLDQHERIGLFVQSKAGEIQRRLDHLHTQIVQLGPRELPADRRRVSLRKLETFSRAEENVLKVGEDIQSLARFVGAQSLAFQKLLKKYTKWTASSSLRQRFTEILNQPNGLSKRDFKPLLLQWTIVLATVREPFKNGIFFEATHGKHRAVIAPTLPERGVLKQRVRTGRSVEKQCHQYDRDHRGDLLEDLYRDLISNQGTDLGFDVALAGLSCGKRGRSTTYWIHHDNLIELQIVLLQYTRLRVGQTKSSGPPPSAPNAAQSTRRSKDGLATPVSDEFAEETNVMHLKANTDCQSGLSASLERGHDLVIDDRFLASLTHVSWSAGGECIVLVHEDPDDAKVQACRMRAKELLSLLRRGATMECLDHEASIFRANMLPLTHVSTTRARFIGLGSDSKDGIWATLDTNIIMTKAASDRLGQARSQIESDSLPFLHAVLQVRWEGRLAPDLVRALDESHLTEKVPDFSMEAHAIAVLYPGNLVRTPAWMPTLNHDIRKVPPSRKRAGRRSGAGPNQSDSTLSRTPSTAPTSVTDGQPSEERSQPSSKPHTSSKLRISELDSQLSLERPQRKKRKRVGRVWTERSSYPPEERYWNEYDDGDDRSEDRPYTIFVDPNAGIAFPRQEWLSNMTAEFRQGSRSMRQRIISWFSGGGGDESSPERRSLIVREFDRRSGHTDPDIERDVSLRGSGLPENESYGTLSSAFPQTRESFSPTRTRSIPAQVVLLTLSSILCLIGVSLAATGPPGTLSTRAFVVVAILFVSLGFALASVGVTLTARVRQSWIHQVTVLMIPAILCVGNGGLLAFLAI